MKRNRRALLILGLLCFAAAFGLTGYNLSENSRAKADAETAILQLQTLLQSAPAENTLLNPAMEMPVRRIGGGLPRSWALCTRRPPAAPAAFAGSRLR